MIIQWCLKGIPQSPSFGDAEAQHILDNGIASAWLRSQTTSVWPGTSDSHKALSKIALDDHVNNFTAVSATTPYISVSSGTVLPNPGGGVTVEPAWRTALEFATDFGNSSGYIFRLWTIVSPKTSPDLAGVSEAVRDLSIFRHYWRYHHEGEVAAKIIIPARQIEWCHKVDTRPRVISRTFNADFVGPDAVSNVVEVVR